MNLINFFTENHSHLLFLIAGISFVLELAVMGLSGPLLFFAIACFLTAILSSLGIITGWEVELFSIGLLTSLIALILWKPLKRFQNRNPGDDTSSDMIGLSVPSATKIDHLNGAIRYSGVNWTARLDNAYSDSIAEGTMCEICAVKGNVMIVKPIK